MKAGRNALVLLLATSLSGFGGVGVRASAGRAGGGDLLIQTTKQPSESHTTAAVLWLVPNCAARIYGYVFAYKTYTFIALDQSSSI